MSQAPDIDDPSNWVEATDPSSGRSYWINKTTNETSWSPPPSVNTEGDGEEWEELVDETSGRTYFVNTNSRRATWSRPELNQLLVQERYFRYLDKRGKEQGPFPESKMQEWYREEWFDAHIKCREETSEEWSTIGNYFDDYDSNEDYGGDETIRGSDRIDTEIVDVNDDNFVNSKVDEVKQKINALSSEIGGTQRMTSLAQQNASQYHSNSKRGKLYVREKGMIGSSFYERYFVLDGNKLSWYDDEAHVGNKTRGALVLNQNSTAVAYSDADEDSFKGFRVTGEGDDVILQAPRYMAMKAWINAIGKSVKELTGATHTEVLETMTESAISQVKKLSDVQKLLENVVVSHIKEVKEEESKNGGGGGSSSPSSSPRLNRTSSVSAMNVMTEILNKVRIIGKDINAWKNESENLLTSKITDIKRMSRKNSDQTTKTFGKSIEGYLTKRAMSGKNSWKKRYFTITPSGTKDQPFVTCKYMSKPGAKVKGVISLSGHTSVEKKQNIKGKDFVFEMHEGGDTLCVSAGSDQERDDWINAIKINIALFVESESETTSKTSDHFTNLINHMNMSRSMCQRLLKVTEEYDEAEKEEDVKRQVS
jgi:hypothetical protein